MTKRKRLSLESLETRNLFASDATIGSSIGSSETAIASTTASSPISFLSSLSSPITSTKSGNWSDPRTWKGGVVPTANDMVTIANGHSVVMDAQQSVRALDVAGSLKLSANLTSYGNVSVLKNAQLTVDNAFIHFVVADDTLFVGGDSEEARGDTGLWIEGNSKITGDYKTPYLDVVPTKSFTEYKYGVKRADALTTQDGQTLVKLSAIPVNWKLGDELLIGSPEGQIIRTQLVQIVFKLDGVYAAIKSGSGIYALQADGQTLAPKIVNLTRSAGISAGEGNHKAHVTVLGNGVLNASNAEFKNLGAEGKLGRYPIFLNETRNPSVVEGSSIYSTDNPSNRGIVIHATANNVIRNNVIYNVVGNAVFMEDPKGNEIGNQIVDNITLAVNGDAQGNEVVKTPEAVTHNKTAHYWVRPGNTVAGNVAIGGTAIGLIVMPGKANTSIMVDKFVAYGVGRYGIQSGIQVVWCDPIVVNADVAGYGSMQTWGLNDSGSTINAPLFILNGENPDSPFITDTDRAYISQIYVNQTRQLFVNGGFLAGKKGIHVHYASAIQLTGTKLNVGTLVTPTYYESDVLFTNSNIQTDFLADFAYSRRASQQGRIRIDNSTYNGKLADKTYVSRVVAADAGLSILSTMKDQFGRDVAVEVPNIKLAGYVSLPSETKFVRYRLEGSPTPTWWPVSYTPPTIFAPNSPWDGFSTGMFPGRYIIETFDVELNYLATYVATISGGKISIAGRK